MGFGERLASLPPVEDRYRLLVDAITDYAIYMLDRDGFVTSWNAGAQRFKGYTPSEILGEHFSRFYTEEERAAGTPARALRTAAGEGRFEQEGWRVRKDGTISGLTSSSTPCVPPPENWLVSPRSPGT